MKWARLLIPVALAAALGLLTEWHPVGWPADIEYDELFVQAAWSGVDPSQPAHEVAAAMGSSKRLLTQTIARPPATWIVMAPFAVLPSIPLVWVLNLAACAVIIYVTRQMGRLGTAGTVATAVMVGLLTVSALVWGNPAPIWGALISVSWWAVATGRGGWWGVPLGVAAAMRLWPLLIIVALFVSGRRKMAVTATGAFSLLTLGGMLAPGVTVSSSLASLTSGSFIWSPSNISLAGLTPIPPVLLIAAGGVIALWAALRLAPVYAYGAAVLIGLLVSPITWPSYYLALIPAFGLAQIPYLSNKYASTPFKSEGEIALS